MARVDLSIRCEMDALYDNLADLEALLDALPKRHGERFRDLERRILKLGQGGVDVRLADLGEGLNVAVSDTMTDILSDARRLGVI